MSTQLVTTGPIFHDALEVQREGNEQSRSSSSSSSSTALSRDAKKARTTQPSTALVTRNGRNFAKFSDNLVLHIFSFVTSGSDLTTFAPFRVCHHWERLKKPLCQQYTEIANARAIDILERKLGHFIEKPKILDSQEFEGWGHKVTKLIIKNKPIGIKTYEKMASTFPNLKELHMSSSWVHNAFFTHISKFQHLKVLSFNNNVPRYTALPLSPVVNIDLSALQQIKLESLSVSTPVGSSLTQFRFTDESLVQLSASTPTLRSLHLGNCRGITHVGIGALAKLPLLDTLGISHIEFPNQQLPEALGKLTRLRTLIMNGCHGAGLVGANLSALSAAVENLRTFECTGLQLSSSQEALALFHMMPNLRTIKNLDNNGILPRAIQDHVMRLSEQGKDEEISEILRARSIDFPNEIWTLTRLSTSLNRRKDHKAAKPYLLKAIQIDELTQQLTKQGKSHWLFQLAQTCFYLQDFQEAIEYYQKVLQSDPLNFEAYKLLGEIYFLSLKQTDEAIKHYSQAVRLNDRCLTAHEQLGYIFYSENNYKEAKKHLLKACELQSINENTYGTLAEILYFQDHDPQGAITHLHKAISLNGEFVKKAHLNLALILKAQGNVEEAEKHILKAQEKITK